MTDILTNAKNGRNEAEEIIKKFLTFMMEKDMDQWIELWDDNSIFEFPYAPNNYPKKIEGKSAIYNYIKDFPEKIDIFKFSLPKLYQVLNSNIIIVEFECEGQVIATGLPYKQKYISVIETNGGKIIHYKDYWNPLVGIEAFGGKMEAFLDESHKLGE